MPRYFFHTVDGVRVSDDQGVECDDERAARLTAIRYAADVIKDQPELLDDGDFRVEVTDEQGTTRFLVLALTVDTNGAAG